jgi:flavin-dependent dehydrogenase
MRKYFDVIGLGAGSAGATVARRLAISGRFNDQWNHCPQHSLQFDGAGDRCGLFDFAFALDVGPQIRHLFVVFSDIFTIRI